MAEYVEFILLSLLGRDLDDVVNSVTETLDRPTKPVNTMNRRRTARGFKQGNRSYQLEVNAEQIDDPNLPSWEQLWNDGTYFKLTKCPSVGKSVTWDKCKVTRVQNSNSDGD